MTSLRVLLVKTSSLGDVIHMLPAVSDAIDALPHLQIDWLVEEGFAAIPAWHAGVQRVIPIAMRRWRRHWTHRQTWDEIGAARAAVRATPYDLIVDTQGLLKSAVWARMARGLRCGYDSASAREPLAARFYQRHFAVSRGLHAIARNRNLLAQTLGYALPQGPGGQAPDYGLNALSQRLTDRSKTPSGPALTPWPGLPSRYVVGLHGTSRADKEWPVAHWQHLANALRGTGSALLLPAGNALERERAQAIAAVCEAAVALPPLSLDALALILDGAQAVVGVDTGLMHLAAALGKPGLALYTATPAALTGAISDRAARGALINCEGAERLAPEAVAAHVQWLLSAERSGVA